MSKKKIYLASSWRNTYQPETVIALRTAGHEVYDFRNPKEGETGFSWSLIDPEWKSWTPEQFKEIINNNPIAEHGWSLDQEGMDWCNACVLLLPSGNSAHLEAGWCAGKDKPTVVYAPEMRDPDLMYKTFKLVSGVRNKGMTFFCTEMSEVLTFLMRSY